MQSVKVSGLPTLGVVEGQGVGPSGSGFHALKTTLALI